MSETCESPRKCANCKGSRMSSSKQCPNFLKESKILKLKYERNISFAEARKLFSANEKPSYASVATSAKSTPSTVISKVSVATQTDTSWLEQKEPFKYIPQQIKTKTVQSQTKNKTTMNLSDKKHIYDPTKQTTPLPLKAPPSPQSTKHTKKRNSKKQQSSDRVPKAERGPVVLHNRYQDMDPDLDHMEASPALSRSPSPSQSRRRASSADPGGKRLSRLLE